MVPVVGECYFHPTYPTQAKMGESPLQSPVHSIVTGGWVRRVAVEGTLLSALGRLCIISTMDPKPPMTMIREEPPTDFEVAVRVARRLWKFSDAAISFAGSSEGTRVEFVAWVKDNLRRIEKKGNENGV